MTSFFLLQNIRSLSKNFKELSQLVSKKDPLLVALTETWTTEFTNAKLFHIENYQEILSCNQKKRGGGVGIYLKKILNLRYYLVKTAMLHNCLPFLYSTLHLSLHSQLCTNQLIQTKIFSLKQ